MSGLLKRLLYWYGPQFARTVVYMLQASMYRPSRYLAWFWRTRDFSQVAKRQHLVRTAKTRLLLLTALALLYALLVAGVYAVWQGLEQDFLTLAVFGAAVTLLAPVATAHLLLLPLVLGQVLIQKPRERKRDRTTAERLTRHPATKIAIAGSYGKTSFKENLAALLGAAKAVAAAPGTYNTPAGVSRFVKNLKGDEDVLIFEFGEHFPGDVQELSRLVNPDIGVIAGINEAHLESFGTLDKTAATVFELANYLGDRPVYVNGENALAKQNAGKEHRLYTREGVGGWRVEEAKTSLQGTTFTAFKGTNKLEIETPLLGLHQVGPIMGAIAIADELGMPPAKIKEGANRIKPVAHRLQPRPVASGIVMIDDSYNGNPDGVRATIEFLKSLKGHRRLYLTPGLVEMGSRTAQVHTGIGRQLAGSTEIVALVRNSVTPYIKQGLTKAGYKGDVLEYGDTLTAITQLNARMVRGDVLVVQNDWPDNYA